MWWLILQAAGFIGAVYFAYRLGYEQAKAGYLRGWVAGQQKVHEDRGTT